MVNRRIAVGLKHGHVERVAWVSAGDDDLGQPLRRDPQRASRGILIAVPFAILLWVLALGAAGFAILT